MMGPYATCFSLRLKKIDHRQAETGVHQSFIDAHYKRDRNLVFALAANLLQFSSITTY